MSAALAAADARAARSKTRPVITAMPEFIDFGHLKRSDTPNDYLVAPADLTPARPDRIAPVYDLTPAALFAKVTMLLEMDKSYHEIETDAELLAIKAVAVTPILRFRDDVNIRVVAAEGGASLAIYSRSRIGMGDMGTNRKRVDALLRRLEGV